MCQILYNRTLRIEPIRFATALETVHAQHYLILVIGTAPARLEHYLMFPPYCPVFPSTAQPVHSETKVAANAWACR
jgi:hypothetical protein